MRRVLATAGLGAMLLVAGCNSWPHTRGANPGAGARASTETPTREALVDYLNRNARAVQSVDVGELDLDARQGVQSVGLRGWMVCQKPKNFRMTGQVFAKDAVDMGSNDREFWYWISKAEPPYLFHCSYEDLAQGRARMPFPFQPDWIMESLGIQEYGPPENYQVVPRQNTVELVEMTRSPQGQPVRKVTVFNNSWTRGGSPQVTAHLLQDASGKEICGAYITDVQQDRATGAVLPRKLRLVWPSEKMSLAMTLAEVQVNTPIENQRAAVWFTRPTLDNVSPYNLARGPDASPTGIRRASGSYR